MNRDDIKKIAEEVLMVDPIVHADDHRYVQVKRRDEEENRVMRKRIIESALFWVLPIAVGWMAMAAWNAIKAAVLK